MSLFYDIKNAAASYVEAMTFISKHQLKKMLYISFLCYLIVFLICAGSLWYLVDLALAKIVSWQFIQNYTSWLKSFSWLLTITKIIAYISSTFLLISVFKSLFMMVASPLYAFISEYTAEIYLDQHFPFSFNQFMTDVVRGIRISIINLLKQMLFTIPLFLLSFIPIFGIVFTILLILLDSYYYGFSMLDYNFERHRFSVKQSFQIIRSRKGLAIGNGLIIYVSLLIPIIGIVVLAPISVMAAMLTYYKNLHQH